MFALVKFDEFRSMTLSQQGKRLLNERIGIDKLCSQNKSISYFVHQRNDEGLPIEYEIIYLINSFIGVGQPKRWNGTWMARKSQNPFASQSMGKNITCESSYPIIFLPPTVILNLLLLPPCDTLISGHLNKPSKEGSVSTKKDWVLKQPLLTSSCLLGNTSNIGFTMPGRMCIPIRKT